MANKTPRLLHILKTKSLESDGRVLKWIASLEHYGYNSDVFILEDNNKVRQWSDKGNNYWTFRLGWRKLFKKGNGYVLKVPESAIKILRKIKRLPSQSVVIHDSQHYLVLFFLVLFKKYYKKKVIWDLHEIPHTIIMRTAIGRYFLRFIMNRVDLLVYTNQHRREYILENVNHREQNKVVLNNYVDSAFLEQFRHPLPAELANWLGDDKRYILWLGEASVRRNFLPVLESIKTYYPAVFPKIVVLGKVDSEVWSKVNKWGFSDHLYSAFVPQNEMINYIDNAFFSVVLYKNISANNLLCEPNRLYQLMSRRIPVICGDNPPMAHYVQQLKGGVVLEDDGSNVEGLINALGIMEKNHALFKTTLESKKNHEFPAWESQFENIYNALRKLDK